MGLNFPIKFLSFLKVSVRFWFSPAMQLALPWPSHLTDAPTGLLQQTGVKEQTPTLPLRLWVKIVTIGLAGR